MKYDRQKFRRAITEWQSGGLDRLRYQYDNLPSDPIFFDLGAFSGGWSKAMINRYGGTSYLFEIAPSTFTSLSKKFGCDEHYKLFNFGLSDKTYDMNVDATNFDDAFSVCDGAGEGDVLLKFEDFNGFVDKYDIDKIDVMKINIEGGEYDLLESIEDFSFIGNVQIQFHNYESISDCAERRERIRNVLSKTHKPTYDYYFVWENWEIK